jgi:hypothetical protein
MTDITKYKNVTLTKLTYSHIQTLSKEVFDVPISLSKTIQYLAEKEIEEIKRIEKEKEEAKKELESKKKNSHGKSK